MKLLAVPDSYIGRDVFAAALAAVDAGHDIRYVELDETRAFTPATPSESKLREYLGAPAELCDLMSDEDALIVHSAPVSDEVLDRSPRLGLVACARGGPVNIDVEAASARGIPVVTTPGRNAEAVADQTLAFMIMLARKFPMAQRRLADTSLGSVSTFEGRAFMGHELGGHTLGLVGFGQVGRRVASRARAFGMLVIVYDPYLESVQSDDAERVDTLDELISRADFVSLHARASADNEDLFDAAAFEAMRPGAFFVNTARETLVDEAALEAALSSGRLGGAALDVTRDNAGSLLRHDNVVLTPHIGGATHETLARGAQMVAEAFARFAAGEPLVNVVNPEALRSG